MKLLWKRSGIVKKIKGVNFETCVCICGCVADVRTYAIGRRSFSCGKCSKATSVLKHGMSKTRLYSIYMGMMDRCYRRKNGEFFRYGGRGIQVCEQWKNSKEDFFEWAKSNGYRDDLTIDRINSNLNYSPENCRWATKQEQSFNTRNNVFIEYKGITKARAEWARLHGIKPATLVQRLKRGLSMDEALELKSKRIRPPNRRVSSSY